MGREAQSKRSKEREEEEKVLRRWHEAVRAAPSLISLIFKNGEIEAMARHEIYDELEKRGIDYEDADFVIEEAARQKLICLDYNVWNVYHWVPLEKREEEKRKTEQLKKAVEDVFLEKNVRRIPEKELEEALIKKGLSDEDVKRALNEAERDSVISCGLRTCELIPPEDRERMPEVERLDRLYTDRWLREKMLYEEIWEKEEAKERERLKRRKQRKVSSSARKKSRKN